MKAFVFWTGTLSVAAGAAFQFPDLAAYLMPSAQPGMLLHLFGLMAIFLGGMLILCSRDLKRRGALVIWEGVLRLGGAGVMGSYGLFGDGGLSVAMAGLFDLTIGVIYLVGLPRHLDVTITELILDEDFWS